MEIIKEKINTTSSVKKIHINKTVSKSVKIPDINLNARTAPRCRSYVCLTSAETAEGALLYKGEAKLFFACDPDSEYIKLSMPISDALPLEGDEKDYEYKPESAQILSNSVSFTSDGDLNYSLNMVFSFIVIKNNEFEIISDIRDIPSEQTEKSAFTQCLIKYFAQETFKIKNDFNLIDVIETDEIDEIDNIYESHITLKNIAVKTDSEGITAEGNALINITYNPKSKNSSVNFKKKIPFSKAFPLKGSVSFCNMNLSVTDDNIFVKQDENGKSYIIDFEIDILASYFLICEQKVSYISEVHEVNKKIDTVCGDVPYLSAACRNSSEFVVNEPLMLDGSDPAIFQIYRINCTAVTDTVTPYRDKITAEGFLTSDILYAAKDDENPIYSTDGVFPYKKSIELPGTSETDDTCIYTNTSVKYAEGKISDETNVSVDAKISITAYAFKKHTASPHNRYNLYRYDSGGAEYPALYGSLYYKARRQPFKNCQKI
ncbi:MAG: DUF3794 domain-containing protein [Clostridiales bacterium]|nr:DUF3794 domain-containing protein [Clostridiales bacterium]